MKEYSNRQLPLVETEPKTLHIRFNEAVEERQNEDGTPVTVYSYDHVRVPKGATRSDIIEGVVRYKYTQSEMEAVVNNYLREDKTEEQTEAFNTMQAWRVKAKEVADEVLEELAITPVSVSSL